MNDDFTKNITESVDSIKYPINVYGDVKKTSRLSIDIGGSLAKLVYLVEDEEKTTPKTENGNSSTNTNPKKTFQMRFVRFPTIYIEECLNFIQQYLITSKFSIKTQTISATGGGAIKYGDLIKNKLGLKIIKEDEIDCVIKGCVFLLKHVKNECFTFNKDVFPCYTYHHQPPESLFPFLLVNIGSGVSMIKVESNDKYERVGGTSLGGGTFLGLGSLLTSASDFDELLKLADDGNNKNVDMLVKDIYGRNYDLLGLPGDLLASSFGKMIRFKKDNVSATDVSYSQADIAKGLLNMISNTIGQLAYLYARIHNLNKIFFGGYFTRNHTTTLHSLSNAVKYYSNGEQSAYFFRHEGFLGALGAYTNGLNRDIEQKKQKTGDSEITVNADDGIFVENIAASSYKQYDVIKQFHPLNVVSLDFTTDKVSVFPNLEASSVTVIDAVLFKEYIKYIEDGIDLFIEELKLHFIVDAEQFSKLTKNFVFMLKRRLECFKEDCPSSFNHFYALWDLRDNFIKEYLLIDPFLKLKHDQNFEAIEKFQPYINTIDNIENIHDRFQFILDNLFAGNLIDMSSTEFLEYKKNNPNLNHSDYLKMIKSTKSIYTDGSLADFIGKFTSGKWKKVVIFVDNSGYDIIFGVYGLVREFLKIGATVVLIANTYPSFNDVVSSELTILASRLKKLCPLLNQANDESLFYGQTGFGSSCLDLKAITSPTCDMCNGSDLVIIEGQSRCLVNNFNAKFKCDSLKLGTCTSNILAKKYHFKLFDTFIKLDLA